MMPHPLSLALAAATILILPALAAPAWAEKPLPPAFGKELVPEGKAKTDPGDPAGALELENKREKPEKRLLRPGARGRNGRVRIQLDGDEDGGGGGGGEFGSDAGSDPDAGDF